ncbi:hypothetical protein BDF19DRAFT_411245 [Syncephalis fuscata]|nr:hypothetical protein BDF19DRAFT_411245 [Syncephalis fuscata]
MACLASPASSPPSLAEPVLSAHREHQQRMESLTASEALAALRKANQPGRPGSSVAEMGVTAAAAGFTPDMLRQHRNALREEAYRLQSLLEQTNTMLSGLDRLCENNTNTAAASSSSPLPDEQSYAMEHSVEH